MNCHLALRCVAGAATLLLACTLTAATIAPPAHLGELAVSSEAVVLARVQRSEAFGRSGLVFTRTHLVVEDALSGPLETGEAFVLQTPGGALPEMRWLVAGSPSLIEGETYLLFLDNAGPHWLTRTLAYGILRRARDAYGHSTLVPLKEAGHIAFAGGANVQTIEGGNECDVLERLRAVLNGGAVWEATCTLSAATGIETNAMPSNCVFAFDNGPTPYRWRTFDTGGSISIYGTNAARSDALDILESAVDTWSNLGTTALANQITFGGRRDATMNCTGSNRDVVPGSVVFDDPCGDVGVGGCSSSSYAFGGPIAYPSTHIFDNAQWRTIEGWGIVVNDSLGCLSDTNYRHMLEHELGHVLGFGHNPSRTSLMYETCCPGMSALDIACTEYAYPRPSLAVVSTIAPSPNPIVQGSPVTISASIKNFDNTAFNGQMAAALHNAGGAFVGDIEVKPVSIGAGATQNVTFSKPTILSSPGDYQIWIKHAPPGGGWVSPTAAASSYENPIVAVRIAAPGSNIPPPPDDVDASDGDYSDRIRVNWDDVSGATHYLVYRGTSSGGSKTLLDQRNSSSYTDYDVEPTERYYYWVKSGNNSGTSVFSDSNRGYTSCPTQAEPGLVSPSNGATEPSLTPTLSWSAAPGAKNYEVVVNGVLQGTTSGTSMQLVPLQPSITYNWYVVARNACGEQGTSLPWSFTTQSGCDSFSINPPSLEVTSDASSYGVAVNASPADCQGPWSAAANDPWLSVWPANGVGTNSAAVTWTANSSTSPRTGTVTIAGNTLYVTQQGTIPICTSFSINPTSVVLEASGGSQLVTVTGAPAGCQGGAWSTGVNEAWATIWPASGTGSGSVTLSWSQNPATVPRHASGSIGGNALSITQNGSAPPTCTSFTISPSSVSMPASAGSQSVAVSGLPSGCEGGSWSASGNGSWLTVSGNGTGPGITTVSWPENSGAERTGYATIAGHSFSVTQSGGSLEVLLDGGFEEATVPGNAARDGRYSRAPAARSSSSMAAIRRAASITRGSADASTVRMPSLRRSRSHLPRRRHC